METTDIARDARVLVIGAPCTDDCMCDPCMAANDLVVASQDTFTRVTDEAGLYRLERDYRAWKRSLDQERVWARFRMAQSLVEALPCTASRDPMSRRWDRTRVSKASTDPGMLTDSPVAPTDRSRINW